MSEKLKPRIISLVPSQTELLVDLGLESQLVGVTKFCVHPVHLLKEKIVVGGTKKVDYSKIRTLRPDIILCNKEENTQEMIPELEKIAPVHISDIFSIEDTIDLITYYGALFGKESKAEKITTAILDKKAEFETFIKDFQPQNVAYFIWKNPWMIAAKNNFIDALLRLNGFVNYYGDQDRYPEVVLNRKAPETAQVVFLSTEPYPFKEEHIDEVKVFFPEAEIIIVDGEMFSWYGSRLIKAFDYFKKLHQRHFQSFSN